MNALEKRVIEDLMGSTSCLVDRHKQLAILSYAKKRNIESEARRMILAARFNWINWLTVSQRNWQCKTKNKNKAKHHDSISLREKYVRCNGR